MSTRSTTPRRTTRFAPIIALCVSLAACTEAGSPDPNVRVDTLNGIEHTVAADAPERGEEGLEFLWRSPDEAAVLEGIEWANPTAIAMNEDHIAVLDPQLARVHTFTSDGERAGSFGRRGEGPGELSGPMSLAVHGDSILVASMLTPLQWFGRDGSYLGRAGGDGVGAGAYFLPGAGIVRRVVNSRDGSSGAGWEHLDLEDERHPIDLPGDHPMQPHISDGGEGCWRRGSAGPNLVEMDCTFPLVRVVDAAGRVVREHRIDRDPQRTPDGLIEEAIDSVEARMRASSEGVPLEMANQLISQRLESMRTEYAWTPVMRRVIGSVSGHRIVLVEEIPEELGGGYATLHVLGSDGRYLARHTFDRPIGSLAASDTQLVVMVQDEDLGLRHMEAYRLP